MDIWGKWDKFYKVQCHKIAKNVSEATYNSMWQVFMIGDSRREWGSSVE